MAQKHKYFISYQTRPMGCGDTYPCNTEVEYDKPITMIDIRIFEKETAKETNTANIAVTHIFKFETPAE